jgi:hypothetical protein
MLSIWKVGFIMAKTIDGFWEFVQETFSWEEFDKGKTWVFLNVREMRNRETGEVIGAIPSAQIISDTYSYKTTKKGYTPSPNIGIQIEVPMLGAKMEDFAHLTPLATEVRITDAEEVTWWNRQPHIKAGKIAAVKGGGK